MAGAVTAYKTCINLYQSAWRRQIDGKILTQEQRSVNGKSVSAGVFAGVKGYGRRTGRAFAPSAFLGFNVQTPEGQRRNFQRYHRPPPFLPPLPPPAKRRRAVMSKQYNEERIRLFAQLSRTLGEQPALDALRRVPRERFLPELLRPLAYCNIPLSIGYGQTISQPYMVAKATAALELQGDEDVLEVGAGCGYQAAALAEMLPFGRVFATERIPELRALAARNLETCGFDNVTVRGAGATLGAPEDGPFDAILVSAAAPGVPHALVGQLKSGGRMVVPVGGRSHQTLTLVRLTPHGLVSENLGGCRFVPLLGDGGWPD